ncbi:MAG: flagellin [Euryarchaeota archaeon]|nr:flagellin [Euryarchaeota archaeon]
MSGEQRLRKDNQAAIGIGTLIIFIAMVLVAAVAAGVLIQTSGFLQQKAASTGRESTEQVASGISVAQVVGHVDSVPGGKVDLLAIYIEPNAGSAGIDLNTAVLTLNNESVEAQFKYNSSFFVDQATSGYGNIFNTSLAAWRANISGTITNLGSTDFGIIVLQDADGSITQSYPTLNKGDKVIITVNASAAFNGIEERTDVSGELRPEFGAPGIIDFTTPPAYTDHVITLQ